MKRYENKLSKITKNSIFIVLSLFIHLTLLLFSYKKKSVSLGEKLIPVEIFEMETLTSKGSYLKNHDNKSINEIRRNINEEKTIETNNENNRLLDDNPENIIKLEKNNLENKSITNPPNSEFNKKIGNEGNINKNQIEKGSLKGDGAEKVVCLTSCRPEYPKIALRRGFQGLLILKLFIARSGEVIDVKVIQSTGYKILDKAGIESAKNSKYLPLKKERTIITKDSFVLNN